MEGHTYATCYSISGNRSSHSFLLLTGTLHFTNIWEITQLSSYPSSQIVIRSYRSSFCVPPAMASHHHLQLTDARYVTVNNVTGDQKNIHVSNTTIICEYY